MTTKLTTFNAEDYPQRSEQWHQLRLGMVTASVVGRLVTPANLNSANNPDSRALVDALAIERILGFNDDPDFDSQDMWRGRTEEPRARTQYAEEKGVTVDEMGFMVRAGEGWSLGYSPDGLVGMDGLIEIKAPRAKSHMRTLLDDEVPSSHMAQIQAALLVTGRQWCDFISWHGGQPMYVKRVLPDQDWHDAIVEALALTEERIDLTVREYRRVTADMPKTERLELVVI